MMVKTREVILHFSTLQTLHFLKKQPVDWKPRSGVLLCSFLDGESFSTTKTSSVSAV